MREIPTWTSYCPPVKTQRPTLVSHREYARLRYVDLLYIPHPHAGAERTRNVWTASEALL